MDSFKIPDTPPLPSQEADVPETKIPEQLGSELDLGDDDESEDNTGDAGTVKVKQEEGDDDVLMTDEPSDRRILEGRPPRPIDNFKQFEHADSLPSTPGELPNPLSCSVPKDPNYVTPMMDFSDPVRPPIDLVNPFGANNTLSSSDPIPITIEGGGVNHRRLSDAQQQKLSDYIDDKLLTIQRGFVKYLSSKKEAEDVQVGLAWEQIAAKIDEVIEFIWYAIFQIRGVPVVYHSNILVDECIRFIFCGRFQEIKAKLDTVIRPPSQLLVRNTASEIQSLHLPSEVENSGYESYLIRIMGDLIDYIVKYDFTTFADWIILLRLTGKIDNVLSILIDYSGLPTTASLVSTTDKVRVASIIQRTKIAVVELFDRFVLHLGSERTVQHRTAIDHFQIYAGETYEGLVDRTSM